MSIGSILVGLAVALVVGAFVARPFRQMRASEVERAIESWVAQARAEQRAEGKGQEARGRKQEAREKAEEAEEPAAFCPQCGRRVGPEDRFCARCGRPLRGGAEE